MSSARRVDDADGGCLLYALWAVLLFHMIVSAFVFGQARTRLCALEALHAGAVAEEEG